MKQTFEEYLMEHFQRNNPCTDDLLPEMFNDWLESQDIADIMDLAEKWGEGKEKQAVREAVTEYYEGMDDFLRMVLENDIDTRTYLETQSWKIKNRMVD